MANLCDKNCDTCIFMGKLGYFRCCNYLLATGKRRPCNAGSECTVKFTKQMAIADRKKKRLEEKARHMRTVICPVCGTEFNTTDSRKIFCSRKCCLKRHKGNYRRI